MRIRNTAVAAAAGSALLAAAALPATALPATALPATVTGHSPYSAAVPEASVSMEGPVAAAELLAKVERCSQISKGRYRPDAGASASIPVCGLNGAVFWKADMDIDCDGQRTTKCNSTTDPWFLNTTSYQQSNGAMLNSEKLPHIVVPVPSSIWDYRASGIRGGSLAAVIHKDKVRYAVVGDTGPAGIIGEASYATAEALGINPDPRNGGVASGVTYILFTYSEVSPIESHSAAVGLAQSLVPTFLMNNRVSGP
ncbi:glycoside hydrolase family 75 protein [Streptomyces sp. NBC_01142]|uniref:glycoside hydrolase family 75 protein n=1 Tax=Streptomyces sp. NBC_01142 TaxID=2975865 RepID=UPI00225A94BA|nr:glycoside hydrolase family 75 protein [Streptomyces sp. NBC_01142]MCX4820312.1 glycoside hydrolase family 75 protein [Streptomyces sp. NBC_01142]